MSRSVCLIVLAAGLSTRMGSRNKLLLPLRSRSLLEHAVSAAVDARVGDVMVVTGAEDYASVLKSYPVRIVENEEYEEGMASSIRCGVTAAERYVSAYGIVLADMPLVRPDTIARLAQRVDDRSIVVPEFDGRFGHPVLFAERYRPELLALRGDVGARSVIENNASEVVNVETDDPGILRDVDTEQAYRNLS